MSGITVPFFISHQGCPQRCVFCDQQKIAGAGGALPTAAEILEKISMYRSSAKGRTMEVAFFGGTFTALPREDQEALLEPLQGLLSSGELCGVRISTRPDSVDTSIASFLREKWVRTVELGVQSLDDEVLNLSGRGHSAAHTVEAAEVVKEAGLALGIQLMPGLPGDTRERSLATLERALALDPDFLRIYPTLVLEGTELAEMYRSGAYRPLELDEALSLCKEMLLEATRRGVPVIRMGLQPTAELESGVLLAGPYHPAFGQLVAAELHFDLTCRLSAAMPSGTRISLSCGTGRLSDLVGQRRRNVDRMQERLGLVVESVREDAELSAGDVVVEWAGGISAGTLLDLTRPPLR
ncbi:radical SAM protein [Geomonas sp. RF6]|uniref:elongator complex protein 3 n=1 Tax=Geomonas sp. RF6 TaxID=2897342 RepID=UPI001E49912F|nr:radical SAM protein [Geomonas sp. RF6]UFS68965.1 radical SAM protein [Geomonas sp. RF6]